MPESAVIFGGTLRTAFGSRIANRATMSGETIGILAWVFSSVITAYEVTSDPEPLVVGIATSPCSAPIPTSSAALCMALAVSMTEPPP